MSQDQRIDRAPAYNARIFSNKAQRLLRQWTEMAVDHQFLKFVKCRDVCIAVVIQAILGLLFAHGYDFRVEYVAGRNIVDGISPYFGGTVSGWMALGYGSQVQGLGETPLWALYLGVCYFVSYGEPFIFNFLSKMPIVAANVLLAFFVRSKGARGWRFFLFNLYLIATTVTWGKPDNVATVLAVYALVALDSTTAAILLSTSFMIKPIAIAIFPAFFSRFRKEPAWAVKFMAETFSISAALFLLPFIVFGWSIDTIMNGFSSWFVHAGALSPFNILAILYGTEELHPNISWVGYLVPFSTLLLVSYAILWAPRRRVLFALVSSALFFTMRPWNSEQNLVIVFALFLLLKDELPSPALWIIPLTFAIANNALQEQLYLLWPMIIDVMNRLYAPFNVFRLWVKFFLSVGWLAALWFNIACLLKQQEPIIELRR